MGQHQPARDAGKQHTAELFFQRPDLLADGGMGDIQLNRRAGKTEMTGGGLKGAQRVKGR